MASTKRPPKPAPAVKRATSSTDKRARGKSSQPSLPTKPTQQARSARTRTRLLEAVVESLVAVGYGGTTTNEVCRRAKVTRGTMLHHFPNRGALIAEAAYFVFEKELDLTRGALSELPDNARRPAMIVELMWEGFKMPFFYAWLELVVASRTDADLRAHVQAVQARMQANYLDTVAELFPRGIPPLELADGTKLLGGEMAFHFSMAVLSWLSVDLITMDEDDPLIRKRLAALKKMARSQFSGPTRGA